MLTTLKSYLILAALLLLLGGGVYIQSLRIEIANLKLDVVTLQIDVETYKKVAQVSREERELADKSCSITMSTLRQHYELQMQLQTSQQATGDAINSLPTLTLKENANEAPTTSQRLADDDRLSPDTMRLLDKAYCDGDKDHCASPAK